MTNLGIKEVDKSNTNHYLKSDSTKGIRKKSNTINGDDISPNKKKFLNINHQEMKKNESNINLNKELRKYNEPNNNFLKINKNDIPITINSDRGKKNLNIHKAFENNFIQKSLKNSPNKSVYEKNLNTESFQYKSEDINKKRNSIEEDIIDDFSSNNIEDSSDSNDEIFVDENCNKSTFHNSNSKRDKTNSNKVNVDILEKEVDMKNIKKRIMTLDLSNLTTFKENETIIKKDNKNNLFIKNNNNNYSNFSECLIENKSKEYSKNSDENSFEYFNKNDSPENDYSNNIQSTIEKNFSGFKNNIYNDNNNKNLKFKSNKELMSLHIDYDHDRGKNPNPNIYSFIKSNKYCQGEQEIYKDSTEEFYRGIPFTTRESNNNIKNKEKNNQKIFNLIDFSENYKKKLKKNEKVLNSIKSIEFKENAKDLILFKEQESKQKKSLKINKNDKNLDYNPNSNEFILIKNSLIHSDLNGNKNLNFIKPVHKN